jgi:hypothetical protein
MSFHGKDIKLTKPQMALVERMLKNEQYYYKERLKYPYADPQLRRTELILGSDIRVGRSLEEKGLIWFEGTETSNTIIAFFCYDRIIPLLEWWVEVADNKGNDKDWNKYLLLKFQLEDNAREISGEYP